LTFFGDLLSIFCALVAAVRIWAWPQGRVFFLAVDATFCGVDCQNKLRSLGLMKRASLLLTAFLSCLLVLGAFETAVMGMGPGKKTAVRALPSGENYTNSVGIGFVRIKGGTFRMGRVNAADNVEGIDPGYSFVVDGGDWDEKPVHKVKIRGAFYISETEVTAEQYRQFDPTFAGSGYAVGVNWHEAAAFAKWLSQQEGKPYRLPTEAEWEYVCRAGTTSLFWSGSAAPKAGAANPWGVKNMHGLPREWVLDWHGTYLPDSQVDPVGPAIGMIKVVRGGGDAYNARSASRQALPPESGARSGFGDIGFRLVLGEMPGTSPAHVVPWPQECIKQTTEVVRPRPNRDIPYYNRRNAMVIPPENDQDDIGPIVGVHGAVLAHCHSPGFVAMPNGDLLAVYFSSSTARTESESNATFVQARLRYGSEQWDMPDVIVDFANMNDQSPLLWNDSGTIRFFAGGRGWPNNIPFKWCASDDNGATWSEFKLPYISGEVGKYTPQPITSAFRDPDGNIYFNMDGSGAHSFLWRSSDEGKTWVDMGGRTNGRHSAIRPLLNGEGKFAGTLLCLGTKKGMFADNWMQQNISRDWGKTWEAKTKSPFPYLSSNQRGHLSRLASGKLLFVSDHQAREGQQPPGYTKRGCLVAISLDEGQSWHVKTLPNTLPHEGRVITPKRKWTSAGHLDGTVGYVTVAQTADGIIHVLTTMNQPCQHFEFNEAWIYSDENGDGPIDPGDTGYVKDYEEKYPDGRLKAEWSAKTTIDGRYLLHGKERWYYPNGSKQYEVSYRNGVKRGRETYRTPDGIKRWSWEHKAGGKSVWRHWWPNGRKKSESTWIDGKCEGTAIQWDRKGKTLKQIKLVGGILAN